MKWEQVDEIAMPFAKQKKAGEYRVLVYRAAVPGGWLVLAAGCADGITNAITFYPDPEHQWEGSTSWEKLSWEKLTQ